MSASSAVRKPRYSFPPKLGKYGVMSQSPGAIFSSGAISSPGGGSAPRPDQHRSAQAPAAGPGVEDAHAVAVERVVRDAARLAEQGLAARGERALRAAQT